MLYYYEKLMQKTEPEIITKDTFIFILKQLDKRNKKISIEKYRNGKIILWLNDNKDISCILCDIKNNKKS